MQTLAFVIRVILGIFCLGAAMAQFMINPMSFGTALILIAVAFILSSIK